MRLCLILFNGKKCAGANNYGFCMSTLFNIAGYRVGPQVEKSPNLHITRDSTGSIHENVRGKKFDPKKVRLGWGDLI